MARIGAFDKGTVIGELSQGRNFANQLKNMLHPTFASREACGSLLENIVSNIDNVLSLLNCVDLLQNGGTPLKVSVSDVMGSTDSLENSPDCAQSEAYSCKNQVHKNGFKKRKAFPRWSENVHVCSGAGIEGQLDDGYFWRKYGQKDILGANHPRAYYRCTHRDTQGCLATKQVQLKNEVPSTFEVIYIGKHTCVQERLKRRKENRAKLTKQEEEDSQRHSQQMMNMTTRPDLKVEIQEMYDEHKNLAPFTFPTTPTGSEHAKPKPNFFSDPENIFGSVCSPPFHSTTTPESYISPGDFGNSYIDTESSESGFFDMILGPTWVSDFPSGEMDLWIGQLDFDNF